MKHTFELYEGNGHTIRERDLTVPAHTHPTGLEDPRNYIAEPGLRDAVNVALALGQPLLVTGEPGTGKTCLAASVAWELGLDLLVFHTKTTSAATDLFYHYDALRRFQDAHLGDKRPIEAYITCQALGTAILLANPTEQAKQVLPAPLKEKGPLRSVVLIDEIDKAPRDLPNDVLNEVEKMSFAIKETTWPPFTADPQYRPILVLSSNSEKNLPDAFLRRCVFYHISFPDAAALAQIVARRFEGHPELNTLLDRRIIANATAHFEEIRKLDLKKKPATAEFLGWISILGALGVDPGTLKDGQMQAMEMSYSALAKTREDLAVMKEHLPRMRQHA